MRSTVVDVVVQATVVATCLSGAVAVTTAASGAAAPAQPVAAKATAVQEIRSLYTSEVGVKRPKALRWNASRHALVVTGTGRHGRLRAVAMGTDGSRIGRAPVRAPGHTKPTATDPRTKIRYVATTDNRRLAGRSASGVAARALDISSLRVKHLEAMTFAPSSDTTDPATEMSLYIADSGGPSLLGRVIEVDLAPMAAVASNAGAALVASTDTSTWTPSSPDPSGVVFNPSTDRLVVGDGEVDEMPLYAGVNLYTATRQGGLTATATTLPWSNEPTGIAYNPNNAHYFTTDDDKKSVFEYVTPSGGPVIANGFKTSTFGDTDPEDLAYDAVHNQLLLISGVDREVFLLRPGPDGIFNGVPPGHDDIATQFDVEKFGALDPEGIAYDAARDTMLVVDQTSNAIYELDFNGSLLNVIDISAGNAQKAAGITVAPASNGSGARNYYIVDRGLDNNSHPDENDGKLIELSATLPAITNRPPAVNAGADQLIDLPEAADLTATAVDDGLPNGTLGYTWTKLSGPGTVTFGSPNAASTTATFSAIGSYVLRVTASDSQLDGFDDVVVTVHTPGAPRTVTIPIGSGSDDAQEGGGSSGKFVDLASADIELGNNGAAPPAQMLDGLRFTGLPVPQGGEILSAKIQFKVDETGSQAASYLIRGEAADNPTTYVSVNGNISARPSTTATVSWSPPAWTLIGEAGPNQATPELSAIVQELVNRPGWAQGNAVAFMIDGTGRRTAEAKDGLSPPVLVLQFRLQPPNTSPVVSAGPDLTVTLPAAAALDGTVTDDGQPQTTPTTTWSKVSGPGTVTFANPALVDTSATFSQPGSYTLRLTANDGALSASDDVVVEVLEAPAVSAGPDLTVTLPAAATLDGTVTDDGQALTTPTTTWSKVSGPGTVTFANPALVDTTATFSQPGSYTLRLTADDGALNASDDVLVQVLQMPAVSAGPDLTVALPAAATLDGTATDDGPVQTTWSKVSGPGTVTFANPALVDTTATFSQPGSYILRLTANDGTLNASDDVQVAVDQPAPGVITPHVSGALTRSTVAVGEATRLKGTVSPAADGQPVQLQRRKGAQWVTVATKHLSAGSSSAYSFSIHSGVSGRYRYRTFVPSYAGSPSAAFDDPANGLLLRVYRAEITAVHHAGDEFVEIANTGALRIDMHGWLLVNARTGTQRTLPTMLVGRGRVVRIHSGAGTSDGNDLYLNRQDMWGAHATAVLRNDRSVLLDRWTY